MKQHDFQLAYLVLLTLKEIKPLSRWERPLEREYVDIIEEIGLFHRLVSRKLRAGDTVCELVFSLSEELLLRYSEEFEDTQIDKSAVTRRKEGSFFGYPECCIEHFIEKPYDRNHLSPEDQEILFHWACPRCEITAKLLPRYREIHRWLIDLQ
ncbi:MAG: hypothetical protein ACE5OP_01780 [Candidatus Glassbacteria bacterium]